MPATLLVPATFLLLATVTLLAAIYDWRHRRIPNWLCLVCLLAALAIHCFDQNWGGAFSSAFNGFGLALLIHIPLYLLRATGGGDLKLMAALGALLGAEAWLQVFVLSALLGGVVALGMLLARGKTGAAFRRLGPLLGDLLRGRAPFRSRPELDIAHPGAQTLPRGVIVALAAWIWIGAKLFLK